MLVLGFTDNNLEVNKTYLNKLLTLTGSEDVINTLLNNKLINLKAVRNLCILDDFIILKKNPLHSMSDVYTILSFKYEVSTDLIIKVVLNKK